MTAANAGTGAAAPTPVLVNASRFRQAHQADWQRLDRLVGLMERRSIRSLSEDDLLALPLLYRTTLSSLSVARETSLDRALVDYLEQLSTRAYFQLYGVPSSPLAQLRGFFARDWPHAIQSLWRETLAALLLTIVAGAAGYLMVRSDPAWFYALIDEGMASGRTPSASAQTLRDSLYGRQDDMLATFATYLFTHNSQVALLCFALGFAFAVPTAMLVVYNGLTLGAFFAVFVPKGLGLGLTAWLSIHGTTEIFAILLAAAAGFRIGTAIAFPGRRARLAAAVEAGRLAATAMIGVVIMLLVAGLLEGIGRQVIRVDDLRALIGGAMLLGWLAYFYFPRRRHAAVLA